MERDTQPKEIEPDASEPDACEPETLEPDASEPETLEPDGPWLDGVAAVTAAAWSLACRRARTLSQRELAAAAGVSQAAIQRLETGRGRAAYDTVARVLAATGYELVAVDSLGGTLLTAEVEVGPRDRAGRRLPIHLDPRRTRPYFGPRPGDYTPYDPQSWWGWHSIAWHDNDPAVPYWTFHKRWRPR